MQAQPHQNRGDLELDSIYPLKRLCVCILLEKSTGSSLLSCGWTEHDAFADWGIYTKARMLQSGKLKILTDMKNAHPKN